MAPSRHISLLLGGSVLVLGVLLVWKRGAGGLDPVDTGPGLLASPAENSPAAVEALTGPVVLEFRRLGLSRPSDPLPEDLPQGVLFGVVYGRGGGALNGVTVEIAEGLDRGRRATSDEDGSWRLEAMHGGRMLVRATPRGGAVQLLETTVGQDRPQRLDMGWRMPAVVDGLVQDRFGRPLEGAVVEIDALSAVTDEQGRFRLAGVVPGRKTVVVGAPGHAWLKTRLSVEPGSEMHEESATFRLEEGASVSVRVRHAADGDSRPPLLTILPTDLRAPSVPWERFARIPVKPLHTVEVTGLPTFRRLTLILDHPAAAARPESQQVVTSTSSPPGLQEFRLEATNGVAGLVVDMDGRPVAGARIRVEGIDPWRVLDRLLGPSLGPASLVAVRLPGTERSTLTDAHGAFRILGGRGSGFSVEAGGYRPMTAAWPRSGEPLRISLERPDEAGALRIRLARGDVPVNGRFPGLPGAALLDLGDGMWEATGLPRGSYEVVAGQGSLRASFVVTIPSWDVLDVPLGVPRD